MSGNAERVPSKHIPKFEPLAETVCRVMDNIGKRTGKPEFRTGLEVVDVGLNGLHRTQMTTVAARPGQGKTSLACQMAWNLANEGHKVAFISLEMTKESIIERMFANIHMVDGFQLLIGKTDEVIQQKLNKFYGEAKRLSEQDRLRIVDDYCFTENELYTLIDHLGFRPDVLILDHIQHIRADAKKSNWESLTSYLRYLKECAMRFNMAVVPLSQINREGETMPSLANLKGTGAIEEMSDHVLLMHLLQESQPDNSNYQIKVAKNRFGPVGTFDLYYEAPSCRFFNKFFESRVA